MIAIYARVSTRDGRQTTENQLRVLRQWAGRMTEERVVEYVDEASGTKADRAALGELLNDARLRKFDVCLIWALDRLSREGIGRLSGYLDTLKGYGVRVLSHEEPWLDTAGPVSDLLIAIFGWVAKQERERIGERIAAGLARAKAKGVVLGRPSADLPEDEIRSLRKEGIAIREIAKRVGVPKSTVSDALSKMGGLQ